MAKRKRRDRDREVIKKINFISLVLASLVGITASVGGLYVLAYVQAGLFSAMGVQVDTTKYTWIIMASGGLLPLILTPLFWWLDKKGYINIEPMSLK